MASSTREQLAEHEKQARDIIRLREIENLSFYKIAEKLGLSRSTVELRYKKYKPLFQDRALKDIAAGVDPAKALAKLGPESAKDLQVTIDAALMAEGLDANFWARGVKGLCEATDAKGQPNYKAREAGLKMLGQASKFLVGGDTPPERKQQGPGKVYLLLTPEERERARHLMPYGELPEHFEPAPIDITPDAETPPPQEGEGVENLHGEEG